MENMLVIAAIWMIILPRMKWNILKDNTWICIYSYTLGIYTLAITIMSYVSELKINSIPFSVCFVLLLILNNIFLVFKAKTESSNLTKFMICVALLCMILAIIILYLDRNEIASSIIILTATMIILSTPYHVIKMKCRQKN